ncbi:MAG: imidazole glycerol phosphate synthase subunit HisH [Candidatus Rokuibacteriota bacterium]|nr:MAG: imidazole glycerol phosphate synthase subunit HisH [Candidatus Rokubacteria bacterium]
MKRVAVVDYGMGNLDSVARAIEECGGRPIVTDRAEDIESATHIVLPGVGAFGDGIRNVRQRGLDQILREQAVVGGIPFLGICLGMQMLATRGHEGGVTEGLGWIDGEVRRLEPTGQDSRVPHIGWNEVALTRPSTLFTGVDSGHDFYFVHSYHLVCHDKEDVLAVTPHCGGFVSAIARGRIFGVQFHPEKSQRLGFQVLRNFLAL